LSDSESVPVSVIIAARNEAANIEACVASVQWAREVIVVENDSTDDTIELAKGAGATVMSHPFTTIGAQRNAAIERALSDWILVVDADERGSPALGDEIRGVVLTPEGCDAYRVPRRNFFVGREVKHAGWASDGPIRRFR